MKKTLHILPLSTMGGIETMFINFFKNMGEKNPELIENHYVYALSINDNFRRELNKLKVNLYIHDSNKDSGIKSLINIKKIIKDNKIEIVYGQNFLGNLLAGSCKFFVSRRLRVIVHEHGSAWSASWKLRLFNFLWIHLSDKIICNSKAARIVLRKKYLANNRKLKVIYNGVPTLELENRKKKNQIIIVGRLVAIKSTITILNAMPILLSKYPDLKLIVLGDGKLRANLEKHCNTLGISSKVEFKGTVENVAEYISESKLLVLPSVRETLGNVIIEAAFQKVPSIGANIDGIPEVIKNNKTGILITPTISITGEDYPKFVYSPEIDKLVGPKLIDPNILAKSIDDLLKDNLYQSLGQEAYKYVKRKFNFERYYNELVSEISEDTI